MNVPDNPPGLLPPRAGTGDPATREPGKPDFGASAREGVVVGFDFRFHK